MFEFLENYRETTVPAPGIDGVVLTCHLNAGLTRGDIPVDAPGQLRELWARTAGGMLFVDEQFGICGLVLHDPVQARQRSRDRTDAGYEVSESDWVLGEFVGDTDMLVVDGRDAAMASAGSYPRGEWYRFDSLADLLRRYVESHAEKYWERSTR